MALALTHSFHNQERSITSPETSRCRSISVTYGLLLLVQMTVLADKKSRSTARLSQHCNIQVRLRQNFDRVIL